ncbi:phage tail protein [Escherichia coli]|uniref:Phage tail collar domain-containing protein n=1 Tax=Escherichia coli TaxID=562 RepID=A0A377AV74_ECOLX|nr:phage tail protein [Escherichia coli]STL37116.1 phage tail collar domain-containing protein [Escherichia coli]
MSTKFYTLLTDIGAAKLASAAALGVPLKITHMAVGDGGGVLPTPDSKQTALVNEKRRAALNMLYIDPQNSSQIIAEQVIPENEGGWWIREVGLFDESGALIAVGNCPESYKPQLAEGSGRTQTVRMVLITSSTDNIILKIDPAVVLATRKYVDDKVLELKLYVDDQMRNHIAAQDPHTQYAQKHNPTFTGEPKAPTPAAGNNTTRIATTEFVQAAITALINGAPATLDTLKEIAAAINNDPNFATTMLNALAGKQPLDNTLTNLSGKDVAGLLAYLGLGEAAKRNVGNGENQIPDMSFWTVTGGNGNFVIRQPDGLIIQMVTVSISGPVAMNGMTDNAYAITGSNKSYIATATLPFVFPNKVLGVIPLVSTTAYGGVSSNITGSYATAVCSFAAVRGNNTIVFKVDKPLNAAFPSDTSVSALIIGR